MQSTPTSPCSEVSFIYDSDSPRSAVSMDPSPQSCNTKNCDSPDGHEGSDGPHQGSEPTPPQSENGDSKEQSAFWRKFAKRTTLHGLTYVSDSTSIVRRALWMLVLLSVGLLFVIQVFLRTRDYLRYDTNVNMQVVYRPEVMFPAVTVCNQNRFRLTSLVDVGLYGFIDDVYMYDEDNTNNMHFSKYGLEELDTETFLRESAHQKTDLIERCYWKGKPCDVETAFVTVQTGLGVCYTFNSARNDDALTVNEPGSMAGLSLVLNLEQYEFSSGPQSDAGAKLLLHGQEESPMIDNLGFSVAAGTHTQVGVSMAMVETLPEPHGSCTEDGVPMSECLSNCHTRQVTERCGCRSPHMRQHAGLPKDVCGLKKLFSCAWRTRGSDNNSTTVCECSQPCKQTTYDASLSYAQLSHFNIIKPMMLGDQARQEAVWKRQYVAREMFQQVDPSAIMENENEYTELLTRTGDLGHVLGNLRTYLTEEHILGQVQNISKALLDDVSSLKDIHYPLYWELDHFYRNFSELVTVFQDFSTLQSFLDPTPIPALGLPLVEFLKGCLVPDISCKKYNTVWNKMEQCSEDGMYLYFGIQLAYEYYVKIIEERFSEYPVMESQNFEHQQCMASLQELNNSTVLTDVLTSLDYALFITDVEEHTVAIENLIEVSNTTLMDFLTLMGYARDVCDWGLLYMHAWNEEIRDITYRLEGRGGTLQLFATTVGTFILPAVSAIEDVLDEQVIPIVNISRLYVDGQIWKLDLFDQLQHPAYKEAPDNLEAAVMDLLDSLRYMLAQLEEMQLGIPKEFLELTQKKIPVLQIKDLQDLAIVDLAGASNLADFTSMESPHLAAAVNDVVHRVFNEVVDPITSLKYNIQEITERLSRVLIELEGRLQQFAKDINMDQDFYKSNFVKIDIFYKELKYDQITQFPAFEILSLLGEVGGFLGLLMGASVLTVIELLDGIAMAVIGKFRKKRDPPPSFN